MLIDALLGQKIIRGNETIAAAFADAGDLVEFAAGKNIIEQGTKSRAGNKAGAKGLVVAVTTLTGYPLTSPSVNHEDTVPGNH